LSIRLTIGFFAHPKPDIIAWNPLSPLKHKESRDKPLGGGVSKLTWDVESYIGKCTGELNPGREEPLNIF